MFEKSIETQKGTLYYKIKDEKVTITTYQGNDTALLVPERIEKLPVRKVGKKAFCKLNKKSKISVPGSKKKQYKKKIKKVIDKSIII